MFREHAILKESDTRISTQEFNHVTKFQVPKNVSKEEFQKREEDI